MASLNGRLAALERRTQADRGDRWSMTVWTAVEGGDGLYRDDRSGELARLAELDGRSGLQVVIDVVPDGTPP